MSLIEIVSKGGCYWKRERPDSPGHSIAVPNGTAFRIAIEGPQSHRFVTGICTDGYFVADGIKFRSASEAVNKIREPQSNAFLHMQFVIRGNWISADNLRSLDSSRLDEVEEFALETAFQFIRHHPKGKLLNPVDATRKAAQLIEKQPNRIEEARRSLASIAEIDPSELGF